jgi:brefeldin A-resistance guanine nucleotide exchange factor 1
MTDRTEAAGLTAELHSMPPTLTRHTPITIAVDPVALVITECITVTSAMRKHARWAHSSISAILGGVPSKPPAALEVGSRRPTPVPQEDEGWRWGSRSKKGKSLQDNPLMSAFTKLRSELRTCKGMGEMLCMWKYKILRLCRHYYL